MSQRMPDYEALRAAQARAQESIVSGREAVAWHMYGESVEWRDSDMREFDADPKLRSAWQSDADRRIRADFP